MKSLLLVSTALAGLMLASAVYAQSATGTGTSNSTSNSGASSGAQGVVGPQGNAINAGTSNSNSGSNSRANTRSDSRSQSSGNANAQQIQFNTPGQTTSANSNSNTNNSTGGTNNTNRNSDAVSYSGGTSNYSRNDGDVTVRSAPTVYAPPVSGGSPCSLGYSAGASFLGWGAAAGGQVIDSECERRMHVAMLYNAGWKGASKELACNNKEVYFAFRSAGEPCIARPQWEGAAPAPMPPMVQQQPTPIQSTPVMAPAPVAGKVYPKCNPARGIVDNCVS